MAHKDDSKQWFETGDYPTQEQCAQVFEWLRWKDEKIGTADLDDDLLAIINAVTGRIRMVLNDDSSFTVPAEYALESVAIRNISSTDITIKLDYPAFIYDGAHWQEILVPAHGSADLAIGKTFWASTPIKITGFAGLGELDVDNPIIFIAKIN